MVDHIAAREIEGNAERDAAIKSQEGIFGDDVHENSSANEAFAARVIDGFGKHIKRNFWTILKTTAAGNVVTAAAAVGVAAVTKETPEFIMAAKAGTLFAYPMWKTLYSGLGAVGKGYGHQLNWIKRDRYRDILTENNAKGLGRGLWVAFMLSAGVAGSQYIAAAQNLTYRLPYTATAGLGSYLVDNLTEMENTAWDPVWEGHDYKDCLDIQQSNPDHVCWSGPMSEEIEQSWLDGAQAFPMTEAMRDAEISHYGRLSNWWVEGVYADSMLERAWSALPDVDWTGHASNMTANWPSEDDVNAAIADQIGLNFAEETVPAGPGLE